MATIFNQIVEKTINEETGEIVEKRETQAMRFGEEPTYVKLYLKDLMYLNDVPAGLSALMYELLHHITYAGDGEGMIIGFNPYIKKIIQKKLGYKTKQALNNGIHKLTKGHLLYRIGESTYQLNPHLFGKGNWADVARIRLKIDYSDIEGKTFGTVIKYKNADEKKSEYEEAEPPEY